MKEDESEIPDCTFVIIEFMLKFHGLRRMTRGAAAGRSGAQIFSQRDVIRINIYYTTVVPWGRCLRGVAR